MRAPTMRILAFLLVFLPNIALSWEDWDKQTRDNFWRSSTWIALDWHSTDMIASRGWDGYREKNIIMGPYPSQGEVALYFAARIGLNYWMHDQGLDILAIPMSIIHAHAAYGNYSLTGDDDKIGHILVGAAVGETVSYYTGSRWKGCAAALAVGVAKELGDSRFDIQDATATALGCSIIRIEF